jgi:hypothetical protein
MVAGGERCKMTTETIVTGELRSFIEECAEDYYALRLVLFFASHPETRFYRLAIIGALSSGGDRQHLTEALDRLVDRKIMDVFRNGNGTVYKLANNTSIRRLVLKLGELNLRQRLLLLGQARCSSTAL